MNIIGNVFDDMRRIEEEKKKKIKGVDDGSIRGLILSGDYRKVGRNVFVPKKEDGNVDWIYAGVNDAEFRIFSEKADSTWGWKDIEIIISDIVTVCRRKIRKEDIILCSMLDTYFERMTGVILTENKIYSLDSGTLDYIIEYKEIDEVDFSDDYVVLKVLDDKEVIFYCHDGDSYDKYREYSKNMYNLIMDIKDRYEEYFIKDLQ